MFGDPRLPERFWSKCMPEPNTGCWLWTTGCDAKGGYSVFFVGGGTRRQTVAHKVAYEALIGPVPAGLVLDHLCRNRWCSNPMHLEVVSRGENVRRGINGALMTHCVRGHEVNEKNTRLVTKKGYRIRECMECRRIRARERHAHRQQAVGRVVVPRLYRRKQTNSPTTPQGA